MTSNQQWHERRLAATPRGVGVLSNFFVARARNAELWDVEGRRFIDFAGGIAVLNTGHLNPEVVEAVRTQLDAFSHSCYQIVPYPSYVTLAERLNALTPGTHARKTAFFSTGAEAVENAIKIARAHTRRSGVIAFGGGFHGRSLFAVALTGKVAPYKIGFGPFPPEIYHLPFPSEDVPLADSKKALERLFKSDIEPERVAAIIFEPVQGEGGFNVIQSEAVQWLREVCDKHGIVLIADEVQTGFGRTGSMFACDHFHRSSGFVPDLMTLAKSLAGGFTLSAVTGRTEIMDAPAPGGLGGTYAGNPLAIAAAHAVIDVMQRDDLPARAQRLGAKLMDALRALNQPRFKVHGLGAMCALDCFDAQGEADADLAKRIQAQALQRGLILLTCGEAGNVLRFLFPLTIEDAIFDEGLHALLDAIGATI